MRALFIATSLFTPCLAVAEDSGLFSTVAIESVYAGNDSSSPRAGAPSSAPRVTGARSLIKLLEQAGFQGERADETTVNTTIEHDGLSLSAVLRVAIGRDEIDITVLLAQLKKDESRSAQQWRDLLSTSSDARGHFVYQPAERRIVLRSSIGNRSVTAASLRTALIRAAKLSDSLYAAWSPEGQPKPGKQLLRVPNGSWVASLGPGEAFAVKFAADQSFSLVHVRDGRSTTSAGKAALSDDKLTLTGADGTTLVGVMSNQTERAFTLTVNGKALEFKAPS